VTDPMSTAGQETRPSGPRATVIDWLRFIVVSAYLSAVGLFLLASRRIALGISLRRIASLATRTLRRRGSVTAGALTGIRAEDGHCYLARVPGAAISDSEGRSRLRIWENDRSLGPAHCPHDDVRREGGGRFSHWEGWVYFSASDNSDPRTNGRTYRYAEDEAGAEDTGADAAG
jgi:hypothetical protein